MSQSNKYAGLPMTVPGKLLGYRMWFLEGDTLYSVHQPIPTPWYPGLNKAICNKWSVATGKQCWQEPEQFNSCSCGFYARYTMDNLVAEVGPTIRKDSSLVVGAMWGTGPIAHGTEGFRAAKAVIAAICPLFALNSSEYKENILTASFNYKAPLFKTADDLLLEFPPDDISEILEMLKRREEEEIRQQVEKQQFKLPSLPLWANPYAPNQLYPTAATGSINGTAWTYVVNGQTLSYEYNPRTHVTTFSNGNSYQNLSITNQYMTTMSPETLKYLIHKYLNIKLD